MGRKRSGSGEGGPPHGATRETTERRRGQFLVVGLGASAGGLEALERFFRAMPPRCGMAFVVVQHLDPDHKSFMPDALARCSSMPVVPARDGLSVKPDNVYVIPPNATLLISRGALRVHRPAEPRPLRSPINAFLSSLAEDQGHSAVGIILSGTGSDGTLGLTALKQHDGLIVAQEPRDAKYDSMPRSAIGTGLVDMVLPAAEMPEALVGFARRFAQGAPLDLVGAGAGQPALDKIAAFLFHKTGHDFSRYKRSTLGRRVQRRIQMTGSDAVEDYIRRLREDPAEARGLFHDLLIGVTRFFRDPEAFRSLEKLVVPALFEERDPSVGVRVWVAGCATGEEAFSVAMLLREHMAAMESPLPQVQIFGTDIDERALAAARQARFPEGIADHVPAERLARFFVRGNGGYALAKEIRELCIFSLHNLIRDPPFSRIDLLVCRNVLIYLEPEAQQRLLRLFHYAIRRNGFLFLGPSETVAGHSDLFRTVDKSQHVYQRKETLGLEPFQLPLAEGGQARSRSAAPAAKRREEEAALQRLLKQVVLDEFTPPCLVVDARGDIRYYWGPAQRYIQVPSGAPTQAAVSLAVPSIRLDLKAALHEATTGREGVVRREVPVEMGDQIQRVDIVVRPLRQAEKDADLFLVAFREHGPPRPKDGKALPADAAQAAVERLESELKIARAELQTTVEELEGANEELRSSNEELQSMNEELQSSNEELQTSQEELQSVNEELQTVNVELQRKVEEVDAAHGDLQNLFQSTQIATLFLDPRLRVARFTPGATEIFHLLDSDVGRPITDLASRFPALDLGPAVQEVMSSLEARELTVRRDEGPTWYLLRIHPYRTVDGGIAGSVLTFTDISALKAAEEALRQTEARERTRTAVLEAIMDAVPAAIRIARDPESREVTGNRAAHALLRMEPGRNLSVSGPDAPTHFSFWKDGRKLAPEETALRVAADLGREIRDWEEDVVFEDGSSIHLVGNVRPLRDADGKRAGAVAAFLDITDRKRAEDALRKSEARFRSAVESFVDAFAIFSAVRDPQGAIGDFRLEYMNEAAARLGRTPRDQTVGRLLSALHPPAASSGMIAALARLVDAGEPLPSDTVEYDDVLGGEPIRRIFEFRAQKHEDGFAVAWRDATDLRRAEKALLEADRRKDEFLAILGHELRNPLAAIQNALQRARTDGVEPAESARMHSIMDRQLAQLERMVDDLLDVTRISRGKVQLRTEPLELGSLVRDTVEAHRPAIADVQLVAEIAPSPIWVQGDRARLTQVLTNLLSNATKFTPPGGRIRVGLEEAAGVALLTVEDTGPGIDEAAFEHLFEPFAQGPQGLARSRGGLGLGLALVKTLVEMHGGSVSASSAGPGLGARLEVRLAARREQRGTSRTSCSPRPTRPRRVLVIEDGRDVAEALSAVLGAAGHSVEIAYDGASGLQKAPAFQPDVVLCDLGLPGGLDGYAVARAFRADPVLARVPILALSGYAGDEDRRRALDAGFVDHIQKPAGLDVLQALFDRYAL